MRRCCCSLDCLGAHLRSIVESFKIFYGLCTCTIRVRIVSPPCIRVFARVATDTRCATPRINRHFENYFDPSPTQCMMSNEEDEVVEVEFTPHKLLRLATNTYEPLSTLTHPTHTHTHSLTHAVSLDSRESSTILSGLDMQRWL